MTGIEISKRLARLWSDRRGNSLPLFAASLVPLMAIVGGGVDASRGYLTKTQLQNACDAGALAGRRAMAKTGVYEEAERAKAQRMFDANFEGSVVDAPQPTFETNEGDEGNVFGTAAVSIPTVLMKLFGKDEMSFSVNCMAELQITNSDIMFVLDVTGSMAGTRITGLRQAVRDFHNTIASSVTTDEVRVRYGFVPYSMTVNARNLLVNGDMPMDFIADQVDYQSRRAYFNTPQYIASGTTTSTTTQTYSSAITSANCTLYGANNFPSSGSNPVNSGSAPSNTTVTTYSWRSWSRTSGSGTSAVGTCQRNRRVDTTTYDTVYRFNYWRYAQASIDVSALKSFGPVSFATGVSGTGYVPTAGFYDIRTLALASGTSGITRTNFTWDGCIEERATVAELDMDPPPDGATDLDINSAPDSDDTRWKPYFAPAVFNRGNNFDGVNSTTNVASTASYCPAPMRLYQEVELVPDSTPTWLNDYLNSLVAVGGTYHDIGMIWGARLGSPNGIFADTVNDEPERSVSRHIIFMTDGEMAPEIDFYSAYGMERYDTRVAPRNTSRTGLIPYHNSRFVAACNAAKDEGYTVWVIGFGSALTTEMRACATGHRAYFSNDNAELSATFRYIASQVADLRLGE
jgi:Flp pilus assembly protein TadG